MLQHLALTAEQNPGSPARTSLTHSTTLPQQTLPDHRRRPEASSDIIVNDNEESSLLGKDLNNGEVTVEVLQPQEADEPT